MPLRSLEPPRAVRTAAAVHVDRLAALGIFAPLRGATREELALVAPHRVYTLALTAIAGRGLDEAQPAGWRFLIAHGERIVASAELDNDAGRAPSVNGGPYVSSTTAVIERLEGVPAIAEGDFELRLLKVPALYIAAAWLVDGDRVVVPLDPAPSFLEAGSLYAQQEFVALLTAPAERVAELDDGTAGG
jgi:hypothetical protein